MAKDNLPHGSVARLGTTRFRLPGAIRQVRFSPDGKQIAAIAPGERKFNASIAIFDSRSGRRLRSWVAHEPGGSLTASVYSIAYSPDGAVLASAGRWDGVRFWSTDTWQQVRHIKMEEDEWTDRAEFSPDGKTLAVVVFGAFLDLWNLRTQERRRYPISEWEGAIEAVAFSPDGRLIAAGHKRDITVLECSTGRVVLDLEWPKGTPYVNSLAFSRDSSILAVGRRLGDDNAVSLLSVSVDGAMPADREVRRLIGHGSTVHALCYSLDGKLLASAGYDGTIRFWEPSSGKELAKLDGHRPGITSIDFSPDGRWLVSGDRNRTIRIWDVEKHVARDIAEPNEGVIKSVAFSSDSRTVAAGGQDGAVHVWNLDTKTSKAIVPHSDYEAERIAFSADGTAVLAAEGERRCGTPLHSIRAYDARSGEPIFHLPCGPEKVSSMSLAGGAHLMATASYDKLVRVWDLSSRTCVWEFEPPVNYRPSNVALSPRGDLLAIGSHDARIQLWDVTRRRRVRDLVEHWEPVYAIAFSPDGKRLVSGGRDYSARIWDVGSGRQVFCLGQPVVNLGGPERPLPPQILRPNGHTDSVGCVACSPDGRLIATGSTDTTVRLWSMATGNHLATLEGHEGAVKSVAFSPDSRLLASGSTDTTILVWDVEAALKGKRVGE